MKELRVEGRLPQRHGQTWALKVSVLQKKDAKTLERLELTEFNDLREHDNDPY